MYFLKIAVLAAFVPFATLGFEDGEEGCPSLPDGATAFSTCEECLSRNCGFVTDEGDCVSNCTSVTDSECFSFMTNSGEEATAICELASAAQETVGTTDADVKGETDLAEGSKEEFCLAFVSSGPKGKPTCEMCVSAGCRYKADNGDCLSGCDQVYDGAGCISEAGGCSYLTSDGSFVTTSFGFLLVAAMGSAVMV